MKQENIDILFEKLERHIKRCEELPVYKVEIYVKSENIKTFNDSIRREVLSRINTNYTMLGTEYDICIKFSNGSTFIVRPFGEALRAVRTHVLFVENKIREAELRPIATGSIIPYKTETGGVILTPKPIFFSVE